MAAPPEPHQEDQRETVMIHVIAIITAKPGKRDDQTRYQIAHLP